MKPRDTVAFALFCLILTPIALVVVGFLAALAVEVMKR